VKIVRSIDRARLLIKMHGGMMGELFRFEAVLLLVALLYIFGSAGHSSLSVQRGVLVLMGLSFAAMIETRIVFRNAASLSFYLRLPVARLGLLFLFTVVTTLPFLAALSLLVPLGKGIAVSLGGAAPAALEARLSEVLFAYLFFRSLAVHVMIALGTSFLLIGAYLVGLSGVIVLLLWLQEVAMAFVVLTPTAMAALFLAATFAISCVSVRWLHL